MNSTIPNVGAIPVELRELIQWLNWKYIQRADKAKPDKLPFNPNAPKSNAAVNNPQSWGTCEEALATMQSDGFSGIGFVFTAADPYVGIDLDNCRDPKTGAIESWAQTEIDRFDSYAEISPSGTGVHIIVEGKLPGDSGRKTKSGAPQATEIYNDRRYFCFTGEHLENSPLAIAGRQREIDSFLAERFPAIPATQTTEYRSAARADVIERARKYVALMDPSISSQRGHDRAFAAAMVLIEGFALSVEQARPLFEEFSGRCSPPWSASEIDHKLRSAEAKADPAKRGHLLRARGPERQIPRDNSATIAVANGSQPSGGAKKIEIIISTDEMAVNNQAEAALAAGDDTVFQRGGALVTVTQETQAGPIQRPDGAATIVSLAPAVLRERLSAVVNFVRVNAEGEHKPAHVPAWTVAALAARGQWPGVRPLRAIVQSPTIRRDGSILDRPGYDRASGLFLAPTGECDPIPARPSTKQIDTAKSALLEVIADFPFQAPAHRATWLSGLLSLLARHAYDGPTPLFLFDANTRGSGKSLLADCIALIATGRSASRMAAPHDDEEARKRITAIALAGDSHILLDNIAGGLGCASLDAALTAETWKDRILGQSAVTREIPLATVWFATGNNVMLQADTARRVCYSRIESPDENPEDRQGFAHPDLRGWVRSNRARLLAAGLTILRGFYAAGRPDQKLTPWGSFEGWSDVVRSAVVWSGLPDPAATRLELRQAADRDAELLRTLLEGLAEIDPRERGLTAKAILGAAEDGEAMADAVLDLATSRGGKPSSRVLGRALEKFRGRVCKGRQLQRLGRSGAGHLWASCVSDASSARPEPNARKEMEHKKEMSGEAETYTRCTTYTNPGADSDLTLEFE